MLAWIEMFLAVVACLGIGSMYAITGYEVTNLFTDGPNWKPWEQCLFWLFWPIVIPLFLSMIILFVTTGLLIPILFVIGIIVNSIRKLFN